MLVARTFPRPGGVRLFGTGIYHFGTYHLAFPPFYLGVRLFGDLLRPARDVLLLATLICSGQVPLLTVSSL